MKEHKLSQNMRTDPEEVEFSDYILRIGNGEEDIFTELGENAIQISEQYLVDTLEDLIDTTFPELDLGCENITDCCIYNISTRMYVSLMMSALKSFLGI